MFEHDLGEETRKEWCQSATIMIMWFLLAHFGKLRFKLRMQMREGNILFEN